MPTTATQPGRMYGELEIRVLRTEGGSYEVMLSTTNPLSNAEVTPVRALAGLDFEALRPLQTQPDRYGRALTAQVFAVSGVRAFFDQARATFAVQDMPMRVRLKLDPGDRPLHALRWELLRDPSRDEMLALSERLVLSRFMFSADWRSDSPVERGEIRALIAVAGPSDLDDYGFVAIDVAAEIRRVQQVLKDVTTEVLAAGPSRMQERLLAALRGGVDLVYLVCHGVLREDTPYLFLTDEAGKTARVEGGELARQIGELPRPPRLMVLGSCESAGRDDGDDAFAALAPALAAAGVPAIVAIQGRVSVGTVEAAMPVFFTELLRDGQIDRALAVARRSVRERPDHWALILTLRLRDGRLWREPRSNEAPQPFSWPILGAMGLLLFTLVQRSQGPTALPWWWKLIAGVVLLLGFLGLMLARASRVRRSRLVTYVRALRGFLAVATTRNLIEGAGWLLAWAYGQSIFSWKAFRRSVIVSSSAVVILMLTVLIPLIEAFPPRLLWRSVVALAVVGWLILNILSDFVSVACTRVLIRWSLHGSGNRRIPPAISLDLLTLLVLAFIPTGIGGSVLVLLLDTTSQMHSVIWSHYVLGPVFGGSGEPVFIQSWAFWIVLATLFTACVPSLFVLGAFLAALVAIPGHGAVYKWFAANLEAFDDRRSIVEFGYLGLAVCVVAGTFLAADPVPTEAEPRGNIMIEIYDRNCERGIPEACALLAECYLYGRGVKRDPQRPLPLSQKACDQGNAMGCLMLGLIYSNGVGVAKDPARAVEYYERSCNQERRPGNAKGITAGCSTFGRSLLTGDGRDVPRGMALLRRSCTEGSTLACASVGVQLIRTKEDISAGEGMLLRACFEEVFAFGGRPTRSDEVRLAAFIESVEVCRWLGEIYQRADQPLHDMLAASRMFALGCGMEDWKACFYLGDQYRNGRGVEPDPRRASELFAQACDGGSDSGCVSLARAYLLGSGVERDVVRARETLEGYCDKGHGRACHELAYIHLRGRGVPKDAAKARRLFDKACKRKYAESCTWLKRNKKPKRKGA